MSESSPLDPREISALVALVNQDSLSEAERRARRLLNAHPGDGMLWKILGVALTRQGKDALQALGKAAELLPRDAEAQHNLGAALSDRRQWALALECFRRALALAPNHVDSLIDAADVLRALDRAREAVPLYQRALRLEPQRADARNNLGNAFLELAQPADAAAHYRLALDIRPDEPQILYNLGNAERLLGKMDEALALIHRAISIAPDLTAAHNCLGLIHEALGRPDAASAGYRRALELQPNYVEALNNLGRILRDAGQRREALPLYARAVELDPGRAESHWSLGAVLFELRRGQEAMACYNRALEIKPDFAPAHLSLGMALRQQRRPIEAEASCRAALAIDPDYVEALAFLGELRADRGRFAEAEELFTRAITINPDFSFAYFSISTHRKMTAADREWRQGVESLLAKRPPLGHEISLRYALGKYFDDLKQFDAAFENFHRANELTKRYGSIYDREKLARRVDRIIRTFDAASLRGMTAEGSDSERPVFILGMPRSGTSLTEQILASHGQVYGAGELPFWDLAYLQYLKSEDAAAANTGPSRASVIPKMAADYLQNLKSMNQDALRIVDKMPANFLYAGLIHAAFPRARIIHMRRHPIDTCLSIYFQNFFSMGPYANDLDNLAHYYGEYVRIMNHWRAVLPPAALLEVPYESLIEDQEGWTRRVLDFIGLPWDPKCLDFHQTDRAVITASKWQVRQKISSSSAGRWRHYEKFVGPLARLMELRGSQAPAGG
jgi:tetratricopeptide (TPR) repeat protein